MKKKKAKRRTRREKYTARHSRAQTGHRQGKQQPNPRATEAREKGKRERREGERGRGGEGQKRRGEGRAERDEGEGERREGEGEGGGEGPHKSMHTSKRARSHTQQARKSTHTHKHTHSTCGEHSETKLGVQFRLMSPKCVPTCGTKASSFSHYCLAQIHPDDQ